MRNRPGKLVLLMAIPAILARRLMAWSLMALAALIALPCIAAGLLVVAVSLVAVGCPVVASRFVAVKAEPAQRSQPSGPPSVLMALVRRAVVPPASDAPHAPLDAPKESAPCG